MGRITDRQHPQCLYNKLVLLPKFGKSLNIGNSDYNRDYQQGQEHWFYKLQSCFRASNEIANEVV